MPDNQTASQASGIDRLRDLLGDYSSDSSTVQEKAADEIDKLRGALEQIAAECDPRKAPIIHATAKAALR